ncbi:unnamed protein product [Closterium sp. NIES-54]
MSGGAGGAVAEGEGTGAAGARRASSGGAGGVRVETTPKDDTFPPSSPPRPVAAEPGGVPTGGTVVPEGVVGGGSGSGEGTAAAAATAAAVSVGAPGESRGGVATAAAAVLVGVSGESRGGVAPAAVAAAGVSVGASGEGRGGVTVVAAAVAAAAVSVRASGESRGGVTAAAAATAALSVGASGESRGGVTSAAGVGTVAADARGGGAAATMIARPACLVRGPLPSPPVPPAQSVSSSQWTRRSPLSRVVSPEPRRSRYHADGPFHLLSLTVLHDPLSDYLRASRLVVSRVLSVLVTHPTAPVSSVSALVTTIAGFASSQRLDYAAHLLSGPARSPSSGGAPVFPLKGVEDRQFEVGFLAVAFLHLCIMLLALEGDQDARDIPIPRTHAEAVSRPWASYWIASEEAEMASYRSTGTYVDAILPPGANVVSGMWLYKVKRPPGAPPVFKAHYMAMGFSQ